MFGAVICPKCGQARGIKLSTKKTKCPRCASTFSTSLLKIYFIADNESEIAEAVRALASQSKNENERLDFEVDPSANINRGTGGRRKDTITKDEIDEISLRLIEERGSFTLDEFEEAVKRQYPSTSDMVMARLRADDKRGEAEWSCDFDPIDVGGSDGKLTSKEERIIDAARSLTERGGSFSKDDLKQALNIATKDEIDELMAKLLERGIITEISIGEFRLV